MKRFIALIPAVLLTLAAGCSPSEKKDDAPPAPKAPVAEAPAATGADQQKPESAKQTVEGYAKGLATAIDRAKTAQARTDLSAVNDAVRNYQAENGKYPATLDEIKGFLRAGTDLSLFNYDPSSGSVTIK